MALIQFKLPFSKEASKHYDPITGAPLPSLFEEQQNAALQAAMETAHALESLENNPGWQLIRQAMEVDADTAHHTLLDSKRIEEVYELQQFVKSRRSLISWIDERIQAGKTLLEEKQQAQQLAGEPKGDK